MITIGMGPDAEDGIKDVIEVVEEADRGPLEVPITGEFTQTTTSSRSRTRI